jgi:hypothetical protein
VRLIAVMTSGLLRRVGATRISYLEDACGCCQSTRSVLMGGCTGRAASVHNRPVRISGGGCAFGHADGGGRGLGTWAYLGHRGPWGQCSSREVLGVGDGTRASRERCC